MELKDVVLEVLSDIQDEEETREIEQKQDRFAKEREAKVVKEEVKAPVKPKPQPDVQNVRPAARAQTSPVKKAAPKAAAESAPARPAKLSDEEQFLKNLKERILVMFEGFNSPNNQNVDAKLDLTINFLEYLLSVTDERLDALNAAKR